MNLEPSDYWPNTLSTRPPKRQKKCFKNAAISLRLVCVKNVPYLLVKLCHLFAVTKLIFPPARPSLKTNTKRKTP